MALFK
jgi:hypothetical protein